MDRVRDDRQLFAGREAELGRLRGYLERLLAGRGALGLIEGEAGIGKTSLALAFADEAEAAGVTLALGRCYERGVTPPFGPWREMLDHLRGTINLPLAGLPAPFGGGPPAPTAFEAMRAVVDLLRAAATDRPLLLVLDDLHWGDRDTLELLDLASRGLDRIPTLLLATYRSEDIDQRHPLYELLPHLTRDRPLEMIRLGPLRAEDSLRVVEALHGPATPDLAAYLHARSDGNPLFLRELLRALDERAALPRDAEGRSLPPEGNARVPEPLAQIIRQRISRLGPDVAELLTIAAVTGEEWNLGVIETAVEWPENSLLRALETAIAGNLVAPVAGKVEAYRFAHGLFRAALYEAQLDRRRRRLHARVAAALEARRGLAAGAAEWAGEIAHHYQAAGDPAAARYCRVAGDAARERYANHSAIAWYERALETLRTTPALSPSDEIELHERLGQTHLVLRQQPQAEEAFAAMRAAARSAGDTVAEGRALFWLSFLQTRLYQAGLARSTAEAALRVAGQAGDPRLQALAHWNLGHVHKIGGELDAAEAHMREAERLSRNAGHEDVLSWSLQNLAQMALMRAAYREAESLGQAALALARASRDSTGIGGSTWVLGWAQGELGRYDQSRRTLQAGLDHVERSHDRHYQARLLNTMGWLHCELGDFAAAERLDRMALNVSRTGADRSDRVAEAERYSLLNLATDALLAGRLDEAEARLREFEVLLGHSEYARFRYQNRFQLVRAEVALARGNPEGARQWAAEARRLAAVHGQRKNLVKSDLLAGRALLALDEPEEAAGLLRRAARLADEIEQVSLRWQTRLRLGQAYQATRRPDAAGVLQEALNTVHTLAGAIEDVTAREHFLSSALVRELDATAAIPVAARVSSHDPLPAGLTAREVEVLRLIAQGETNVAIAAILSISVKTVNTHVGSILGKTGSANRAAAAVFAQRRGLA